MIGGGRMRNGLVLLAGLVLAGCSVEIPQFLGREGEGQDGYFNVRGTPPPDPVAMPLREARLERALHGVIVRVDGVAPTDGYWGGALVPLNNGAPDAAGIVTFEFMAIPPATPESISPPRSRQVTAAVFLPTLALKDIRAIRVSGGGAVRTLTLG